MTSGETIFKNLTLKPTALDQFSLPIEIKEGTYPSIELLIIISPLSN